MKPQILVLDNRDDRQEVHRLLSLLAPPHRIRFLQWCCSAVPQGQGRLPVPLVTEMRVTADHAYRCDRADARLTAEVFMDVLQLFNTYSLDATATAQELEKWVRKPEHRKARLHALQRARLGRRSSWPAAESSRRPCTGT